MMKSDAHKKKPKSNPLMVKFKCVNEAIMSAGFLNEIL